MAVEAVVQRARALGKPSPCSALPSSGVGTPALKWRRTANRTQDAPAALAAASAPVPSACCVWQYSNSLCLIEVVLSHSLEKTHSFEAVHSHFISKIQL